MDCDLHVRLTRSGRIIQKLIVLPDVDISEPETDSVDDQRSSFVVESSEKLTSDEETETFKKTEFGWKKKRMLPIDATFKETASDSSCVLQEPITESELEIFLRTLLKMGLVPMLRYSMYWSTELRCDAIADAMSRNRFQEGLRYLHFNANSETVLDRESPRKNTSRLTKKSFHIKEEIS
ncbi:PiggyBac transposable element-derived protein [Trichinella spiralis]|uniref:PiggyBac transposable element-derived protein n=1 Tax=Trichinella spiralis TaxID=6334 RepID=A0ABR3L0F1_TRISP